MQSNLKLYSELGIKIVDIIFTKDSSYIFQAINSDVEKNIDFYLKKYQSLICIDIVLDDFFSKKLFTDSAYCYRIEKIDDLEKRNFYNIYTLNQERVITFEKVRESGKKLEYRIFNEAFCIELYLK